MATRGAFDTGGQADIDFLVNGRRAKTRRLTVGGERRAQLWRTVRKVPEVMVKVSGGGKTVQHVRAHMDYITRNGKLQAITDQGDIVNSRDDVKALIDDWDLDISKGQGKYRQAFNIVLSMPAGTDPQKVLAGAQSFAREKFWGKHQYMMVLHTPETDPHDKAPPHPHVHLVVKAEDFNGKRLYIRKATLEEWRAFFAEKMREQGVEANATPRDLRGKTRKGKTAGVHYAEKRGKSTVLKNKVEEATRELVSGEATPKPWEEKIAAKRKTVVRALLGAATEMKKEGDPMLAEALERFAKDLPKLETERHAMQRELVSRIERQRAERDQQQGPASSPETSKDKDR
jgi:type IV secretion system T-DNA border endonuclease VirD2